MSDKPEVGFQFGIEGDQSVLSTISALRSELKTLQTQQRETASSAEVLTRAWHGLVEVAAAVKLAEFARDVFETAVSLGKLSQITGVSTETLSVYRKAAKDVGVEHEAVDKGIAKLLRSTVLLEAGNKGAAVGFRLMHLSARDFVGLNADQKLRKVTDAIAGMEDGPKKIAAAMAVMGKSGQELIPVMAQLGGEGFAKVAEDAARLGLIFSKEMAEGALRAKAALEDLKGVAEGVVAQFETGLLPAVADAADGIVAFATESDKSNTKGENSFKKLGEAVGWALKAIILVLTATGTTLKDFFLTLGVGLETIGRLVLGYMQAYGSAALDLANGDFRKAWEDIKNGGVEAANAVKDGWKAVADSIADSDKRFMAGFDEMFPQTPKERKLKPKGKPGGDPQGPDDGRALAQAESAGIRQRAQDELTLYRDLAKQRAEEDKRAYDQGILALGNYFDRRRGAIQAAFVEELKAYGTEKIGLQQLLANAEGRSSASPKDEAAKQREILTLKQQISHIDAQAADALVKRDTELDKNENDRAKATQEHLLKELEAQKKLADLEGDRAKAQKLALQIEDLQLRRELEQLGRTKSEIDAFLAQYGAARAVRSGGEAAKQDFSGEYSQFESTKASIEARAAAGPLLGGIGEVTAERELRALYLDEIPILQRKIDKLEEQARLAKQGSDLQKQFLKDADDESKKLEKLKLELSKIGTTWRQEVQSAAQRTSQIVTTGFNGWIQGQEKFGQAVKRVWNGVVMTALESIEKIAAKYIQQYVIMAAISKLMKVLHIGGGDDDAKDSAKRTTKASGDIQIDAAHAAADVFQQAISHIPFPANLGAAPALAAATEAQVMAFQAQAIGGGAAGAVGAGFAAGGYVARKHFDHGGFVTGSGSTTSDSISARLSRGEYVVKASSVDKFGVDALDQINRGAFLPPIRQPAPYTRTGLQRYAQGAGGLQSAGAGRDRVVVTQHNSLSSIDSRDFGEHIDDHMDRIADGIKARLRNFRF